MTDLYDLIALNHALAGTPFAGHLHHFESIDSTNAYALEQAQANDGRPAAPAGSVYFADEQTAGRGRGGHTWHSEPNAGLYVSVLLRPRLSPTAALWLPLATGLAIRSAIAEVCGITADIRWPNDVLLHGKKCCGILVESGAGDNTPTGEEQLRHVVIGVGVNVNHAAFPPELSSLATSLRIETGYEWPRQPVLTALLLSIHAELRLLEAEVAGAPLDSKLLERFAAASTWVRGKRVHVEEAGGYTGLTDGLDERGFLRVLTADGLRTVLSGGVRELE